MLGNKTTRDLNVSFKNDELSDLVSSANNSMKIIGESDEIEKKPGLTPILEVDEELENGDLEGCRARHNTVRTSYNGETEVVESKDESGVKRDVFEQDNTLMKTVYSTYGQSTKIMELSSRSQRKSENVSSNTVERGNEKSSHDKNLRRFSSSKNNDEDDYDEDGNGENQKAANSVIRDRVEGVRKYYDSAALDREILTMIENKIRFDSKMIKFNSAYLPGETVAQYLYRTRRTFETWINDSFLVEENITTIQIYTSHQAFARVVTSLQRDFRGITTEVKICRNPIAVLGELFSEYAKKLPSV